jgi:predicted lipoprotein
MNKIIKNASSLLLAMAVVCGFSSCSDNDDPDNDSELSAKEQAFKNAADPFVNKTVIPTYKAMADAAIQLYDQCVVIRDKFAAGTLTSNDIVTAGNYWKTSRKQWELSEAFLFGPATDHNIDPHIDSWPLDKAAMDDLLADIRSGKSWDIENHGGYGLLGYHSIEYILFELTNNDTQSQPHSISTYSAEELEYLVAVAEDLRNQCILLESCWAGNDGITAAKQAILEDAELGYNEDYGWMMVNAGQAGSKFKTYQQVAEEIIQGCIDIVDEVGNTKIGRPHIGSTADDRNYIESPYSLNSIEDFQDNIRSIQNAYCGTYSSDASVSDYVKSVNSALDTKVRNAITNAITVIGTIPEPFAKTATGTEAANAIDACDALQTALEEAMTQISKQ